ncbi:MAG: hypothetical protein GXO87_05305, partial [Chlorobi bacterium]|nr:hypothetical protein [Chlorobiota bacterium]
MKVELRTVFMKWRLVSRKGRKEKLYAKNAKDFQIDYILKVYFTPSGFTLTFEPYRGKPQLIIDNGKWKMENWNFEHNNRYFSST